MFTDVSQIGVDVASHASQKPKEIRVEKIQKEEQSHMNCIVISTEAEKN